MDWNIISRDLGEVTSMIEQWEDGAAVPEIERDLALEKLRNAYQQIKFRAVVKPGKDEMRDDACRPQIAWLEQEAPTVVTAPTPLTPPAAPAVDPAATAPELAQDAPVAEPACTDVQGEDTADNHADTPKSKIDRKALLSLYDDCSAEGESRENSEPKQTPEPEPRAVKQEKSVEISHTVTVLGEVIGDSSPTVADMYAQQNNTQDIATALGSAHLESLSSAIGLNDKFLMIRDMFDSDPAAYEEAMARFESFTGLDDAMVYIYENYNWNPGDDGVKLLVDLLTRKLS